MSATPRNQAPTLTSRRRREWSSNGGDGGDGAAHGARSRAVAHRHVEAVAHLQDPDIDVGGLLAGQSGELVRGRVQVAAPGVNAAVGAPVDRDCDARVQPAERLCGAGRVEVPGRHARPPAGDREQGHVEAGRERVHAVEQVRCRRRSTRAASR
jgi:hypothetical protein